jgi:chemotaxis protein methyltransferase WspC
MRFPELERLLEETIGLDVASVGAETVTAAVRRRLREIGPLPEAAYLGRVLVSPAERQALVEAVVIPESWFFRDEAPFVLLREFAASRRGAAPPLRVLCAPCAGGEEAYSIAAMLLEAGLPPEGFLVRAVDVSGAVLRRAERGCYGPGALRGLDPVRQAAHFTCAQGEHCVRPQLRASVRFTQGNLMDADFLAGEPPFDVVFCRNLLIYLTQAGRRRLIGTLDRLLAAGGMLFVGHSEAGPALAARFRPSPRPGAFAYRSARGAAAPAALSPPRPGGRP